MALNIPNPEVPIGEAKGDKVAYKVKINPIWYKMMVEWVKLLKDAATAISAGGVLSFNGRGGNVVPLTGDYTSSDVDNASGVVGATTSDALDTLAAAIGGISSFQPQHANLDAVSALDVDAYGLGLLELEGEDDAQIYLGIRTVLGANTTFNLAPTGNDSTGDGTVGLPWETLQHGYDYLAAHYDLNGWLPTLKLADGTYAGLTMLAPLVSGSDNTTNAWHIVIEGNTASPGNVIIQDGPWSDAIASGALSVRPLIESLQIESVDASGIAAYDGAYIAFQNVIFGDCDEAMIKCDRGSTIINESGGGFEVTGDAGNLFEASSNSKIQVRTGNVVTLTGTPAFSDTVINLRHNSSLILNGVTFSGAATGERLRATQNSVVFWEGNDIDDLPGDAGSGPEVLESGAAFNELTGDQFRLLKSGTSSAVASLDLDLSATAMSEFRAFKLYLTRCIPATDNVSITLRTSTAGTGTFDSGANDYSFGQQFMVVGSAASTDSDATADAIYMVNNIGNGAAEGIEAEITLCDPFNTATPTQVGFNVHGINAAAGNMVNCFGGGKRNSNESTDMLQVRASSGNISLRYALYGIL